MWKCLFIVYTVIVINFDCSNAKISDKPNIIVIVADDMGWNDVSFHGSNQIPTPNIDALGIGGLILNRHYVAPMCSPSRSSFMTGKHPISIGMQHYVIVPDQPWGVGLDEILMPQYFKKAGYKTHMIGKWHLGMHRKAYTPTYRGFDTHFGYLGAYIDYYNHQLLMLSRYDSGVDLRRNEESIRNLTGQYVTEIFTEEAVELINNHNNKDPMFLLVNHLAPHTANEMTPLQAPLDEIRKFNYIDSSNRRIYAAMVSKLDESVGKIFKALKDNNMLENSIILFFSDNGSPSAGLHANYGSNAPLRGQKDSPWEGAVRSPSVIWSPLIMAKGRVSNQWIHISDWLHTFAEVAGFSVPKSNSDVDGISQWKALSNEDYHPRKAILNNIDDITGYSSYIEFGWKYVNGTTSKGQYDDYYGQQPTNGIDDGEYLKRVLNSEVGDYMKLNIDDVLKIRKAATIICMEKPMHSPCHPFDSPCLFDIIADPCEQNNLAKFQPKILQNLESRVEKYRSSAVKPRNKPSDPMAAPELNEFSWTWWREKSNIID